MKFSYYIVFLFIICINAKPLIGQELDIRPQSGIFKDSTNSIKLPLDSLSAKSNVTNDSIPNGISSKPKYKVSADAITEKVDQVARDSFWTDVNNKKEYLYGNASINYGDLKINADSIVIDFKNNVLEGYRIKTKTGTELPSFSGEGSTFTFDRIRYNIKTRKGEVDHAVTQEGEFHIVGEKTKFISGIEDSLGKRSDDIVYNQDAIITTCDHDPPHFGIRASKMKFVPKKLAVLSMAQLEIEKVPTPIFLPFGFFPLVKGKSSGLIFPNNYEYNEQLGLGFRGVGYYWPLGQKADLTILGDIYTRGSWGVSVGTNYKKRYGYNGNATVGYRRDVLDDETTGKKRYSTSFSLRLRHVQDQKAHPYINMGGDVNFTTNRYDQRNSISASRQLENTIRSNFSFNHGMPGTPFKFTAEFRHSQNLQTRLMDITLPNLTLRMNTIFPFKAKNSTKEKWTDNIAFSYGSELRNYVQVVDTALFTSATLENLQTGISHNLGLNTNFRVLKYFNLTPSISHREVWLTKKYKEVFTAEEIRDTIDGIVGELEGYKAPVGSYGYDLGAYRDFTAGVSLNTQIFGTIPGRKGFFRGLRHIMKPTVGLNYRPETKERYEAVVDTDTRSKFNIPRTYSVYNNSPFGTLNGSEEQLGISYGITNIIETKYWSKKDSIEKKLRLFDNIGISGFYNFVNDTMPWNPISVSGNTTIFKGLTNFNFRTSYSPYVYDFERRRLTNELLWDTEKKPLQFLGFNGQFTTSISFGKIRDIITGKGSANNQSNNSNQRQGNGPNPENAKDAADNKTAINPKEYQWTSLAAWFENFSFSHSYNFDIRRELRGDTFVVSAHSISVNGSIPLTKNWNLSIGNIAYDIKNKTLPYPYFGLSRDLHCWQMNFSWAPDYGTYSFFIGVKSSALNFIKYDYGQRSASNIFSGRSR